jgi:hypothetical protein
MAGELEGFVQETGQVPAGIASIARKMRLQPRASSGNPHGHGG